MMRYKVRTYCLQTLTVEGTGRFPFDMLRYDSCIPAYESEVHLLDMGRESGEEYFQTPRRIRLQRFSPSPSNGPTHARWLSFGWKVVEWETIL